MKRENKIKSTVNDLDTTPDTKILQAEINNLEKVFLILQLLVKTILFLPPTHYKTIQVNEEKNKTY